MLAADAKLDVGAVDLPFSTAHLNECADTCLVKTGKRSDS